MKRKMLSLILALVVALVPILTVGQMRVLKVSDVKVGKVIQAAPDLYMKDTPADTGIESNPDAGPMWVTEDIWVRNNPDPGYQPFPFPELTPPWTPLPHENPEYRDPKFSTPNYVYIRVRNRGTAASTGAERLRLYWAKASTGLGWPAQWDDYMASNCGPSKLYGAEVTKTRKNAATVGATERNAYRDAVLAVGTVPGLVFPDMSYWHKQDQVHEFGPANRHNSSAFLPWHREFINRYEVLLQEANPLVTLLYWDWTTNPTGLMTPTFMGASGSGPGIANIGPPFQPGVGPTLFPPLVRRDLGGHPLVTTPTTTTDASLMAIPSYAPNGFNLNIEGNPNHPHNWSHVYIGGPLGNGNMSDINTAAEDPFFFLLHGNVDRLWAQWQRNPAFLSRLDPATTYGGHSANVNITTNMRPWDGTGPAIQPWTIADGYIVAKNPKHQSVVSPPFYDTAPLVVPILQPGEAVVIQVPWYPPNPADYACFGDPGHICLLGRITTSDSAPFGMTFPEGVNINTNVRNNNNIVWKNVTVVDNFPGALKAAAILVRNIFPQAVTTQIRLVGPNQGPRFTDFGEIFMDMKPELFARWKEANLTGTGFEVVGPTTIKVTNLQTVLTNIRLEPGEAFPVEVKFALKPNQRAPAGVAKWDLIQFGTPDNPNAVVGGQRFEVDFQKIVLVKTGSQWRYLDTANGPSTDWTTPEFDDSDWKLGRAELGFGNEPVTKISGDTQESRRIATYFRHSFDVSDPSFYKSLILRLKRDDGAVVYVNGTEVNRTNLAGGAVTSATAATREVDGLEEKVFFPVAVNAGLLRKGRNTIAVAIHQNALDSPDLTFDLELYANQATQGFAPDVGFAPATDGSLWQTGQVISLQAEALDTDGQIKSVSFYADGKLLGTDETAPYTFQWQGASVGAHRIRAVALDNERRQTITDTTVVVVENVPPVVLLTEPGDASMFAVGANITVVANASDLTDGIKQVEFFYREAKFFMSPTNSIGLGTRSGSTYSIPLKLLTPGPYMVWAVATDDRGETSQSNPIHIGVGTH